MKNNILISQSLTGILPLIVTETGADDEPIIETIICDSMSGGANYINNMPSTLSLIRTLADGTEHRAEYVHKPTEESIRIKDIKYKLQLAQDDLSIRTTEVEKLESRVKLLEEGYNAAREFISIVSSYPKSPKSRYDDGPIIDQSVP